jgi:hypothetical protein
MYQKGMPQSSHFLIFSVVAIFSELYTRTLSLTKYMKWYMEYMGVFDSFLTSCELVCLHRMFKLQTRDKQSVRDLAYHIMVLPFILWMMQQVSLSLANLSPRVYSLIWYGVLCGPSKQHWYSHLPWAKGRVEILWKEAQQIGLSKPP